VAGLAVALQSAQAARKRKPLPPKPSPPPLPPKRTQADPVVIKPVGPGGVSEDKADRHYHAEMRTLSPWSHVTTFSAVVAFLGTAAAMEYAFRKQPEPGMVPAHGAREVAQKLSRYVSLTAKAKFMRHKDLPAVPLGLMARAAALLPRAAAAAGGIAAAALASVLQRWTHYRSDIWITEIDTCTSSKYKHYIVTHTVNTDGSIQAVGDRTYKPDQNGAIPYYGKVTVDIETEGILGASLRALSPITGRPMAMYHAV